jgi:hypothetical protein
MSGRSEGSRMSVRCLHHRMDPRVERGVTTTLLMELRELFDK